MKLSKNEKVMIIFGFLVVLFYIYSYFDLDKFFNAIVFICNSENFSNPFKPNKIFRYNNKIYLIFFLGFFLYKIINVDYHKFDHQNILLDNKGLQKIFFHWVLIFF